MTKSQYKMYSVTLLYITGSTLLFCILLNGCTRGIKGGPALPTYQAEVVSTLIQKYSQPNAISTDPIKYTVEQRNGIIEDLIFLVDVNYYQFESELYVGRLSFDTATDIGIIGLGAAGTLVDSTGTQAILSAISGGIGGARVSINKNFFHEQSANALISTMRATRKSKLNFIRSAESLSLSDYPMTRALSDIIEYYNAGTIIGACENIISEAGRKEQEAASEIEKKALQFKRGPLGDRIISWLDENPSKNVQSFKQWLKLKNVTTTPVFWVRDTNTTEADLLEVILHFNIPK
jgi:hypothetical protein